MTMMLNQEILSMNRWHKTPNELIDSIVGVKISPNAAWVVMTVIRYTEGYGNKSAAISTNKFMSVLDTKRPKTAYQYIDEAVKSGLIGVVKKTGKTSEYFINKDCKLWGETWLPNSLKPVAENASTLPVAESATSGENRYKVVAENATATSGENRHTYKDNINKTINTKDREVQTSNPDDAEQSKAKKFIKPTLDELISYFAERKHHDPVGQANRFLDYYDSNGWKVGRNPMKDWKASVRTWMKDYKPQANKFTGRQHENHQPNHTQYQQPVSHFDQLRAQAAAKYGEHELRTVQPVATVGH